MDKLTAEHIHREVSKCVNREVSYIDALVEYAEKNDIEVELIGEIVRRSQVMKSTARSAAETLNLVERVNRLPIE